MGESTSPNCSGKYIKFEIHSKIEFGKAEVLKEFNKYISSDEKNKNEQSIDEKNNKNIKKVKEKNIAKEVAFLPQGPVCPDGLTVRELVAFGRFPHQKMIGGLTSYDKEIIDWAIEETGLSEFADREVENLSGGQRQRVAFARALAPNPELLLLDEPFAAIDAKVRQELRSWLRDMITKVGITSIFVTHDQDEAIEVADEIIVTNKGHIEQIGTPRQIYREPETAFMAEFMGHPVHVDRINKIKGFNQLDDSVKAVLRPENVNITRLDEKVDSAASVEKGVVVGKLFMGKEVEITVNVNGIEVVGTRNVEEAPIKKGEEVNVFIHRAFTYGADGIVNIVENANKFEDWMVI